MNKDMKQARRKWFYINQNALDNKIRKIVKGEKDLYINKCWDEMNSFQAEQIYNDNFNYYTPKFCINY